MPTVWRREIESRLIFQFPAWASKEVQKKDIEDGEN